MQVKLLQALVETLAGTDSGRIVEIIYNKKDVNEFIIAKKMGLTINQVRNILYKLSAVGLVSFIRKKDKRKGWYIYYWTLDTKKSLMQLEEEIKKRIRDFEALLKNREAKRYYSCKSCNIEVGEETALEHNFTCEECADVYQLSNNDAPIKEIKTKINKANKELEVIQKELNEIKEKEAKENARKEKKASKSKTKKKVVKKKVKKVKKIKKKSNKKKKR